jgi:anti-sigma regulatory factor (Ser/Thr protein kinase)
VLGLPIQHRDSGRCGSYPDGDRRRAGRSGTAQGRRHELEIDLALQEALANAIRHGCQGDRTKSIQCCVTYDAGDVLIVVRDPGPGFDVTAVANPLDETNLLKGNGRGIFLINQLMEDVRFADGGRELRMQKSRTAAERQP